MVNEREVQEAFERERVRLFDAVGIEEGMWLEGALRRPLQLGEKLMDGSHIVIEGWRDCRSRYHINVGGKQVYVELTARGIIRPSGAVGRATSLDVVVARVESELRWKSGDDFLAFAAKVSTALKTRAHQLQA